MTTFETSNHAFNLIKRLSKSEKKFFTTQSGFQEGEKIYFKIFRAMDKMKEYDEEKLLKLFPKDMADVEKRRKISVNKNYLYNQLLRSLRIFTNEKESVNIQLYNLLVDVQTLRSKGLFISALKRLNKAKKTAIAHEKLLILLEILALEIDIIIEYCPKDMAAKTKELYETTSKTQQRIQEYLTLKELDKTLFVHVRTRKKPPADELLRTVEQLKYFKNEQIIFNSFYAEVHYYKVRALYHFIKKEFEAAAHYRLKVLEMWRTHDKIRKMEKHEYKLAIANYLGSLLEIGKYGEFPELLQEMRDIRCPKTSDEAETFQNVYFFELTWYLNVGKYRQAEALVPKIQQGLIEYQAKVNPARATSLYYHMILLYFVQGKEKFKTASKLLDRILRSERINVREDIRRFAWILEIILHYELESEKVWAYIINRALNEMKNPHPFEKLALKHLKKIFPAADTQKKALLKDFREELRAFNKNNKHFGIGELDLWINSKIRNCTIADILKEEN